MVQIEITGKLYDCNKIDFNNELKYERIQHTAHIIFKLGNHFNSTKCLIHKV